MSERDVLPKGLLWHSDGHASEWVLSALGDGEDSLVPEEVALHVDTCELCTTRMVALATQSVALGDELRALLGERRAPVPFPKAIFGAVLGLTLVGTVRAFLRDGRAPFDVLHDALAAARGARLAFPLLSTQLSWLLFATAALATLVAALGGVTVARRAASSFDKERSR